MQVDIRSKGIRVTEDTKVYISKRLSRLDHFTTRPLQAKVMLKVDGKMARVEITIPLGRLLLRAEESDQQLFQAVDKCAERLESQIKNNKYKLVRNLQEKQGINDLFINTPEPVPMINSAVKIKQYKLEIMTFDEAVTAMELSDHTFYVYKNDKEQVCVVYERRDGEYGLIETF